MGNQYLVCQSALSLEEQGKKVTLSLRTNEEAKALVLDGCVFTDNHTKCDALYLFKASNRKVAALIKLKSAGDIPHAFKQLDQVGPGLLLEKAFIVTNGMLSKPERERLENQHGIRITEILQSEPSRKVPNLRDWF